MKCPNCQHHSETALLKCSACGESYERGALEELQHLEYLLAWLESQADSLGDSFETLQTQVAWDLANVRSGLLPERVETPAVTPVAPERAPPVPIPAPTPIPTQKPIPAPTPIPAVVAPVIAELPESAAAVASEPEPAPASAAAGVELPIWTPAAQTAAQRQKVEKPARPPRQINWNTLWEKALTAVTSGAMLRGLLYLGAFMIVVSATVLVVVYWDRFNQTLQIGLVAAVPLAFYGAGALLRSRLALPEAGGVLMGIGALLLAVAFIAIYQLGELNQQIDGNLYWLVASIICTTLYLVSAWRTPLEFFGYITLLGSSSILLALANLLQAPLAWQMALLTAAALGMVELAYRLQPRALTWGHLARAGHRLPLVAMPLLQALVLFVPGPAWAAQATLFLLAALGYALTAYHFPVARAGGAALAHAAVWSSAGAAVFAALSLNLTTAWFPAAAGLLCAIYLLLGRQLEMGMSPDRPARWHNFTALYAAGFGLLGLSVVTGAAVWFTNVWASVAAHTIAALVLVGCAWLLGRTFFFGLGTALLVIPLTTATSHLLQDANIAQVAIWTMGAWIGLALLYLAMAAARPMAADYTIWLHGWAQLLALLTTVGLAGTCLQTWPAWAAGPIFVVLAGVIVVYVVTAVMHDSGRQAGLTRIVTVLSKETTLPDWLAGSLFLWPIGGLLPIWLAVGWHYAALHAPWFGAALAGLALVYVAGGQLLARRKAAYWLPWRAYAYLLSAVAIFAAVEQWPAFSAAGVVTAILISLAVLEKRSVDTALAALLFLWFCLLGLTLSPLTPHAYSLVYVLVGGAFLALGLRLPASHARILYVAAHGVAGTAVVAALLGRFGLYARDVVWIGAAVPLLAAALHLFSLFRFGQFGFGWSATLLLTITLGQTLTLLRVPAPYLATAWAGFGLIYLLGERLLAGRVAAGWSHLLRWPLAVGGAALASLGLLLTMPGTLASLIGFYNEPIMPLIMAQSVVVATVILAARLYQNRWPLYLEPPLIFLPVTLFFVGHGELLWGGKLSLPTYSIVWLGLAALHLAIAAYLDQRPSRYAHGLYLGHYLLAAFALLWSMPDRLTNLWVLGGVILLAALSQLLAHAGRHQSLADLIGWLWGEERSLSARAAQINFLFTAAYAFPFWLAQLTTYLGVELAWRGFALALLAPLYLAAGLWLRRARAEYTWPLYSAGYALTAVGAMLALNNQQTAIIVLSLNAVVYAASAVIFRQPFWLYLTTALIPVIGLLTLDYYGLLRPVWVASLLMTLAYLYLAAGRWLDWQPNREEATPLTIWSFALPFYAPAFVLSTVALAVASEEKLLAIGLFTAGVLFYALAAALFRESLLLYPAVWLAAVPYYLTMTLTNLPMKWYGLGWLPLIVLALAAGRFLFYPGKRWSAFWQPATQGFMRPDMPFYLLTYGLSLSLIVLSRHEALTLTVALAAAAALYLVSALLFRQPVWLYPSLAASHVGLLTYFAIDPSGSPAYFISFPFHALTWAVILMALLVSARFPANRPAGEPLTLRLGGWHWTVGMTGATGRWAFVDYLLRPSWAQPLFAVAAVDIVLWQWVALGGFETAVTLGLGHALLLGLLVVWWQDDTVAYGSAFALLLATVAGARWAGAAYPATLAWVGGLSFVLYWLGWLAEYIGDRLNWLSVWTRPLTISAMLIAGGALVLNLPFVIGQMTAVAMTMVFAGALYLTIAYRSQHHLLGYGSMALLQLAWGLLLIAWDVRQPQLYAIPAGLYFIGIAWLERRREQRLVATYLESFGLAILLVTTFAQSLDPQTGFRYFLFLLAESWLVVWWAAVQRVKIRFFTGLAASSIGVIAEIFVLINVYNINRWLVFLGVGLLIMVIAILFERQRGRLMARAQEWRAALETWQ
jgi:hypothetical protein